MNRRDLLRRSAGLVVGGAAAGVGSASAPRKFPTDQDASRELARSDWKPVFLSEHQNETLIRLSDLLIPETESGGALAALVNRFIDHLLAVETRETQQAFLNSLAFVDGECRERYGQAFIYAGDEEQLELLNFLAYPHRLVTWQSNRSEFPGHEHFSLLKDWISRAYYSSEIGLKELGWQESPYHEPFTGCEHEVEQHR